MVGDYIIQSDWMASEKTKKNAAALAHVFTYALPFLFLTTSWKALAFIIGTHFIIDRWRLARYVCWVKNFLAPRWLPLHLVFDPNTFNVSKIEPSSPTLVRNQPWSVCQATGYPADKPMWLTVWLMIFTDNIMHVLLNALALKYLA
jgi:hypothetical protein